MLIILKNITRLTLTSGTACTGVIIQKRLSISYPLGDASNAIKTAPTSSLAGLLEFQSFIYKTLLRGLTRREFNL